MQGVFFHHIISGPGSGHDASLLKLMSIAPEKRPSNILNGTNSLPFRPLEDWTIV